MRSPKTLSRDFEELLKEVRVLQGTDAADERMAQILREIIEHVELIERFAVPREFLEVMK